MLNDILDPLLVHIENMLQLPLNAPTNQLHCSVVGSVVLWSETVCPCPLDKVNFRQVTRHPDVRWSEAKGSEPTEPLERVDGDSINDDIAYGGSGANLSGSVPHSSRNSQ
jgi:hypothetical protein